MHLAKNGGQETKRKCSKIAGEKNPVLSDFLYLPLLFQDANANLTFLDWAKTTSFLLNSLNLDEMSVQIYTENWVNSPAQQEDNSWQAFVFVPKGNWYITKASSVLLKPICVIC